MTIWFTSDTHFHHYNIIEYCARQLDPAWPGGWIPKHLDRDEVRWLMNKRLIANWNEKVQPEDTIYHLGDFAFAGAQVCREIFDRLNGYKYLIRGNHDGKSVCKQDWMWVRDYYVLHHEWLDENEEGEKVPHRADMVLFHFPIASWDGMGNGAWHLHGHCHGTFPCDSGLRIDVGVDRNALAPLSFEQVKAFMAIRSVKPIGDCHDQRSQPIEC